LMTSEPILMTSELIMMTSELTSVWKWHLFSLKMTLFC
jgi:hypothetical protein